MGCFLFSSKTVYHNEQDGTYQVGASLKAEKPPKVSKYAQDFSNEKLTEKYRSSQGVTYVGYNVETSNSSETIVGGYIMRKPKLRQKTIKLN